MTQTFNDPIDIWGHLDIAMVRDPDKYTYQQGAAPFEAAKNTRIQLGAGFKEIKNWRNLEYPDWDADYPIPAVNVTAKSIRNVGLSEAEALQMIQPDNTVSEIASYHTLDHLSPQQVVQTLREIERVLVPGGTFTNIVPHFDSTLAKECIWHQSRFGIDTFRNIFSERQYSHDGEWSLSVGLNFIFGLAERNTVLVTQLIKGA